MQPLRKEDALVGLDPRIPEESVEHTATGGSFDTFGGLLLATGLGLFSWAALVLLVRWIM